MKNDGGYIWVAIKYNLWRVLGKSKAAADELSQLDWTQFIYFFKKN